MAGIFGRRDKRARQRAVGRNTLRKYSPEEMQRFGEKWAVDYYPRIRTDIRRSYRAGHAQFEVPLPVPFTGKDENLDIFCKALAAHIQRETGFRAAGGASRDYESRLQTSVVVYFEG